MAEEEVKIQKYVKVPVSDKDYRFLSSLKDVVRRTFDNRLRKSMLVLVEKLRRGTKL